MDEWELIPGRRWIPELEKAIEKAKTAAVMVGENGFGPWEQPEYEAALSEFVKRGLPVIPVLLPGAPERPKLPLFLTGFTWVNLRDGWTEEGLDRLEWGITGKKPTPKQKLPPPTSSFIHNLPYLPLGDLLKGRDDDLQKIETSLGGPAQPTAITQTLHGLGGIGKTRLAVEYAWRSQGRYDFALFVVAESPEGLRSGLAGLTRLGLPGLSPSPSGAQEEDLAAVLHWLRGHSRWLLILDNVDDKKAMQTVTEILPSLAKGHVLITSRLRDWPAGVRKQSLETLTREEAKRFLLQRTESDRSRTVEDDPKQALRLAEELQGLPLALEQAAAFIAHHGLTFAEYLQAWEKERDEVLNWYDSSVMQYPSPIAATWQRTFRSLCPRAAAILRITAYLAPESIPIALFENEDLLNEAVALLCQETGEEPGLEKTRDAVAELLSYSMATRQAGMLTVHRVVQEVLRTRIPEEQRRTWIEGALQMVNAFCPLDSDDVRTWPVWDPMRPHVASLVEKANFLRISHPTAALAGRLGAFLFSKSLYGDAESWMRCALQIYEATPEGHKSEVATCLNNLAQLLKATNRLAEAEPLMRQALDIDEQFLEPQHLTIAIRLNNLASLLQDTNRLAEAEPLMRRAVDIVEQALEPRHPTAAIALNNLAWLLQATNRLEEAEPLMRRAVETLEASLGADHPWTKAVQKNLAVLLAEIASQDTPASEET